LISVDYTAQEYFNDNREYLFPNAEANITATCITYLSFDSFQGGQYEDDRELASVLETSPLLGYAASNWGYHAWGKVQDIHKLMLLKFLTRECNVAFAGWVLFHLQSWRYGNKFYQDLRNAPSMILKTRKNHLPSA
jgi:hypothetical protein